MSILDPSYMIDLGGIDVIQSQGVAIPGLYQKLLDNIGPCGNPLIYNWKFNGVFIPPQFVEPILEDDAIYINDIYVSSDDVVHIPSIERPPITVQLNVSENGEYEAPEGVDGYNPVSVDVQPVIQPVTITENGTYDIPSDVDGYGPVTVNVSSESIIADWDFTQSLIDSVNGFEATLSGATRDSNGVTIAAANDRIILPKCLQGFLRTFEIEVGAITDAAGSVFLISRSGDGIGYKDGSWRLYSESWDATTNVTALDAFANGIIKIYIDELGRWHIYKDDVLLWTSTKTLPPADSTITIGFTSNSLRTMVIKSVKVY